MNDLEGEHKVGEKMLVWDGVEPTDDQWLKLELTTPITKMQILGNIPFQVHRCQADGGIVTGHSESLAAHLGHKVNQPVLLKRNEVMALVKGIIPS